MDELSLNKDKMVKYHLDDYAIGVMDVTISAVCLLVLLSIQFLFVPSLLSNNLLLITLIVVLDVSILIYGIATEIYWRYRLERGSIKNIKLISSMVFLLIPSILLAYLPTNILEWFLWGITIFCLYVWFGKECCPLIKYYNAMYRFQVKQELATKRDVKLSVSSFFSLVIAFVLVSATIALHIYPPPFLLVYFIKYIFELRYFNDFSDDIFYKKWKEAERRSLHVIKIFMLTFLVAIAIALIIFPSLTPNFIF